MGDVPYDFNMTRLNRDKLGRAALSTLLSLAFFGMGATGLGGCSDDEEDKKADEPVEPADDSGGDEVILHILDPLFGDLTGAIIPRGVAHRRSACEAVLEGGGRRQ